MKRTMYILLVAGLLIAVSGMVWGDVIISQYYEGDSYDKWIEITNTGESSVDLSVYYIARWVNTDNPSGNATSSEQLSGTLTAGSSILYQHSSALLPSYASGTASTVINFNGDDPMAITSGGVDWSNRIDCIFSTGEWGLNTSFYRKSSVISGNTNQSNLSGSGEWTQVTNATVDNASSSDSEYLGYHVFTSGSSTTTVQFASSSTSVSEGSGTYNLTISITNPDESNVTTADVVLTSGSASDINNYTTQSITFAAGSSESQTVAITITDDSELEDDETFILSLQNVSGGNSAAAGSPSNFDLTITYNDGPNIVINEILADPDTTYGDANGDGNVNITEDEFVEIVNRSGNSVDISGWKIYDNVGLKHTIPASTIIGNNIALVVFGGGSPTGIPGVVQIASTGSLSLNNNGDDITLKNASEITVISYTYGSEGSDNQSIARDPDFTGGFVKHSTITGNPVLFSPGKCNSVADQSLPVELNGFNAIPGDGEVILCWTTESETENLGFIIQRRRETACLTAQSGQGEWKLVADYTTDETLAGHGSTSEAHEYTYIDAQVVPGATYFYRLGDVDYSGKVTWHEEVEVKVEVESAQLPLVFGLQPAYPNPFNPETTLRFQLGEAAHVRVQVYDLLGNLVATLTDGRYPVGRYNLRWNGCDDRGRLSSTGIYFIHIKSSTGFTSTQKVVFLR